jgi:hypothetical protein
VILTGHQDDLERLTGACPDIHGAPIRPSHGTAAERRIVAGGADAETAWARPSVSRSSHP